MRDIDVREIDWKKLLTGRAAKLIAAAVVVVLAAMFTWRHLNNPPKPWLVRWRLDRYLAKQAKSGDFKVNFAFPAKAEMAKRSDDADRVPTKGSRTGKDFDTLREEYFGEKTAALVLLSEIKQTEASTTEARAKLDALTKELAEAMGSNNEAKVALVQSNSAALREQLAAWEKTLARRSEVTAKEQALEPVVDDLWEFQRAWAADADEAGAGAALAKARTELVNGVEQTLRGASSYESMYRAVGQELFVTKRLLESGNDEHRRQGVLLALTAARQSVNYIMNGGVAARICEGYVLPNFDLATDRNPRSTFNEQNLLDQCTDYFRRNDELNNVVRTYEMALANAKTPEQKDRMLSQIARAQEQAGDAKGALTTIRKIKDKDRYQFLIRRIPRLEQDAKYQK